jgi:hypothetical protein
MTTSRTRLYPILDLRSDRPSPDPFCICLRQPTSSYWIVILNIYIYIYLSLCLSPLPHSRDCRTLPSSVNLLIIISITSPTFASLSRSHRSLQHKQQTVRKSTSPRPVLDAYTFTLNRSLLIDPQLPTVHIYSLPVSFSPIALDHSALGLATTSMVAVAQHAVQQSPPNCFRRSRLPTSRLQLAHQQESLQPRACSAPFCTRRSLALSF